MIHLGYIWAVGHTDPNSEKINYGNDPPNIQDLLLGNVIEPSKGVKVVEVTG